MLPQDGTRRIFGRSLILRRIAQAVKLDPSYVKAHIRLAEANNALHNHSISKRALQDALNAFPKHDLTPQQLALKKACKRVLMETEGRSLLVKAQVDGKTENTKEYPAWRRALAFREGKEAEEIDNPDSSAYQVTIAYREYSAATDSIQHLCHTPQSEMEVLAWSLGLGLSKLAEAIMLDVRIMYVWDAIFTAKPLYLLESLSNGPSSWKKLRYGDKFQALYKRQMRKEGWSSVNSALSIIVKCWIVHAIMVELPGSTGRVDYLNQAVQLAKWARSLIPPESRRRQTCRAMGHPAFQLALQRLHLNALIPLAHKESDPTRRAQLFDEILQEADEVIQVATELPRIGDEAYAVAFRDFPRAVALAAKGYYYWETARKQSSQADLERFLRMSADSYLKAVPFAPKGDELRAGYFARASEGLIFCGSTVREQLNVMKDLEQALEDMKPIWGNGETVNGNQLRTIGLEPMRMLKGSITHDRRGGLKEDDIYRWPDPGVRSLDPGY
ncbi:hypothetical protein WG66_004397 [Moniliophthora roreri]|nr:hypothetical protein WG66_004397 [Moniliophthora roreri]